MSLMAIMNRLVMSEPNNGSAKRHHHRQYEIPWKRQVVKETLAPRSSVPIVAHRHDVNANLVLVFFHIPPTSRCGANPAFRY